MSAEPEAGIPLSLAVHRARTLENLRYDLALEIPPDLTEPIQGRLSIHLSLTDTSQPLVIDFAAGRDHIHRVSSNGRPLPHTVVNGHIVVGQDGLRLGENTVEIVFRAGEAALNRTREFLYTLFVPARGHHTFPCFDQPDLKARFVLELTIPAGWQSVSNSSEESQEPTGDRLRVRFTETRPIPTYLFGFAAGRFRVETAVRGTRTLRMFHRETDAARVSRNQDTIVSLHTAALDWLEEYTAIPYQFGKLDFVLIPSFQFSGMEHPGAVFYNAASLLLDESATGSQLLGRANLIAHETAHMWFGNLATMRWFDDVWMKEVFANFLAAKIVNPAFPDVNHDLQFLVAHIPAAYAVDRTAGTHPIRQPLDNLNGAGDLYGPIIYHKAPVVMRQLERAMGFEHLRAGLRAFLGRFSFGNATWLDLLQVLSRETDVDLETWSRAWVEQSGRPTVRTSLERDTGGLLRELAFVQSDPDPTRSLCWPQQIDVLIGTASAQAPVAITCEGERTTVPDVTSLGPVEVVLPAVDGLGYGKFVVDEESRSFLLRRVDELADPLARGTAWITMWDDLLDGRVSPDAFLDAAIRALERENNEQNTQLVIDYLKEAFWRFLTPGGREIISTRLEQSFRDGLERARSTTLKATYFAGLRSVATTPPGLALLERLWRRREVIAGLPLAETDEMALALALAVRDLPGAADILDEQGARLLDADLKARFGFVIGAVSADVDARDGFFASLSDPNNRRHEPWVIEGVTYLNHPLRAAAALKYMRSALDMLVDIRETGDIFFPRHWIDATLGGHNSRAAASLVRRFLAEHPAYPVPLRRILLQSADSLFRAAAIVDA